MHKTPPSDHKRKSTYLSVVRAHRPTASVRVGEVVPLIVPGPDQISDGLVPFTSNTHSIIHPRCFYHLDLYLVYVKTIAHEPRAGSLHGALHYLPEVMDRFWPMYFMACAGPWSQTHLEAQESADLASPSSQSCRAMKEREEETKVFLFTLFRKKTTTNQVFFSCCFVVLVVSR